MLHILRTLKSTGKGAIILPHGFLFRGGAEGGIRRNVVRQGFIKGIIGLPANLFYGTGIPACIIVLSKEGATGRKGIFMLDASKGFIKDGNKNRLRAQDIHRIVDSFTRQLEVPKYARLAPLAEIAANDFNLNLPRYIDSTEPEDLQDIEARLKGGIPLRDIDGLAAYWKVLPTVRSALFADIGRPGYCRLLVEPSQIKAAIFGDPEFTAFNQTVTQRFTAWKQANAALLAGIQPGDRPKALIESLSESLLEAFQAAPLIDAYDVYQHLMGYWAETMQDDVWMIATDGWKAVQDGKPNTDLIPAALVVVRYFAAEQMGVQALEAKRALLTKLDQLIAKKRDLKQAIMQQLLTCQIRLPGFSGEWQLKAIGKQIDLLTGFPFQSNYYAESGIRLLRGSNVKRGSTDWSEDLGQCWPMITPDIVKYELQSGDLVIAMDGSLVGRSYARLKGTDLPALLLQRVVRIRSKAIDLGFLSQIVGSDHFIKYCDSVKTVTAIPHISSGVYLRQFRGQSGSYLVG